MLIRPRSYVIIAQMSTEIPSGGAYDLPATEEHLHVIDAQLEELLLSASKVVYTQSLGLVDDAPGGGFGQVEVETRETVGESHDQSVSIAMPVETANEAGPSFVSITLEKNMLGRWVVYFLKPGYAGDPLELLRPLAESEDQLATPLIELASFALHHFADKDPDVVQEADLTDAQFADIWQKFNTLIEEGDTPRSYYFNLMTVLDGKSVYVSAAGYEAASNGERLPESEMPHKTTNIGAEGFSYSRVVINGEVKESTFEEIPRLADLPELTEEQRKCHPYLVVPADLGLSESDSRADADPAAPIRLTGYQIISANIGAHTTHYLRTVDEAQEIADNLYRMDLAKAGRSTELTAGRAQYIALTLGRVVASERAKLFPL